MDETENSTEFQILLYMYIWYEGQTSAQQIVADSPLATN
jgi:hypothetical protein